MNERIKELARMSGLNVDGEESFSEFAEKTRLSCFAELIVQEVVSICDIEKADYFKNRKAAYDFEEKNIYAEGEAACDTIKYKVKHRFGVKR